MGAVLQLLPTAVIVGCEVVALPLIVTRAQGIARTLGVIGAVILLLCSIGRGVYLQALPMLFDRFGAAMASAVGNLQGLLVAGLAFLGLALLGAAAILGSRETA